MLWQGNKEILIIETQFYQMLPHRRHFYHISIVFIWKQTPHLHAALMSYPSCFQHVAARWNNVSTYRQTEILHCHLWMSSYYPIGWWKSARRTEVWQINQFIISSMCLWRRWKATSSTHLVLFPITVRHIWSPTYLIKQWISLILGITNDSFL